MATALPRLLKVAEVAEALGLSTANFHAHLARGNFPFTAIRFGRTLRFRESDVAAFINGGAA